jgi:CheY-like chemotaxis protein
MHKRVLVAEAADTTRTVAESVLRQNGFEVISVMSAEKALEVLQFTTPDVLIIGGELKGPDGRPFYERIQDSPKTSSLPLLLFDSADSEGLPFPDEVIIPRPFDPKDFIQRVMVFSGQARDSRRPKSESLDSAGLDDEFLDTALGIDHIDVTDSEVMDHTQLTGRLKTKGVMEKLVGMDHYVEHDESMDESQRIESLMIRDDDTLSSTGQPAPQPPPRTGTGKIEILNDQYGISDPASVQAEQVDADHDYNWFIDSMRTDAAPKEKPAPGVENPDLAFEANSASVDPVTPPPKTAGPKVTTQEPGQPVVGGVKKSTAGVEKFIDEFREEMERIRSDVEPEIVAVKPDAPSKPSAPKEEATAHAWEEKFENITPEQVALFSRQLAAELGKNLAQKLIEKIDSEKLIRLIAAEIAARYKQE